MNNRHPLTATALCLAAGLQAQAPALAPIKAGTLQPLAQVEILRKVDLLPPGKTQGAFRLTGLVRKDRTVVLRWANDAGEMPTQGVHVFRQKVGESSWKDLTGRRPVGYLQGRAAEKRLDTIRKTNPEKWESLLAFPFGDVQHDPATRFRLPDQAKVPVRRAQELSPEKSIEQFRTLRREGRLSRKDLELMSASADMDTEAGEVLGLMYTDDPGRGEYRYKIVVNLLEGGSVEVECPTTFDVSKPTPVPQPINLTAASGNGEVLLNWDETPSSTVGGYNIYRAETQNGPWKRLNEDAVKHVELDVEDPEQTLRRSIGVKAGMDRMLRPLPAAARTPQKVLEARSKALEQVEAGGGLPQLSPSVSTSIQAAVKAGRLRAGGVQAPRSIYTDSRNTPGNALQNERTYFYKVTALDLGGLEQPQETAPVVAGVPKDLEPPKVPGRPMLKDEAVARVELRKAQAIRLQDPRLTALEPAPASRLAPAVAPQSLAPRPPASGLSASEAKRMQLSQMVSTMPVAALKKLGESAVLRSNPDGSVPPAHVAWTPSPDADLQSYQLHRALDNGSFSKIANPTTPEWTDTGLEAGKAYRYAVSAVDKLGNVSELSPVGRVEVSDSSLPGRLAVAGLKGQVAKEVPPLVAVRRYGPPKDRLQTSGSIQSAAAAIQVKTAPSPVVAEFHAPKVVLEPKVRGYRPVPSANKPVLSKEFTPLHSAALSPAALKASVKPITKLVRRSFNAMLAPAKPQKELHVVLEWAKPLQGFPMEYAVLQASQRTEFLSVPRPKTLVPSGFTAFNAPKLSIQPTLSPALAVSALDPKAAPSPNLVVANSAHRAQAARGIVATQGAGLRVAELRKDHMATLEIKGGPGLFTRVNEGLLTTERFVVTFPAEAAQYGGATFYFRIQAFTKEFGRTVEGPLSAPVEVTLPDIVPPPSPAVGSVDLEEASAGGLDVALTWTQAPAKDLAGVLVDRQPMTYTLVEGEAVPGAPAGPPERLTAKAVTGLAFKDSKAPTGYQRYTLRAVDATGNVSEPMGSLDILVPGEPTPGAPEQLALVGGQLTWKAAVNAAAYTVWRSFTGKEDDWECISGILGASDTSYSLPPEGSLHLRVVARSISGMNATPSQPLVRTP